MPLSDLSPNHRATPGSSSSAMKALPGSSLRRSPRLRPSLLPNGGGDVGGGARPRALLAEEGYAGTSNSTSGADASSSTDANTTQDETTIASLRQQLAQAQSQARISQNTVQSIRDILLSAETSGRPADMVLDQLRTLLGVEQSSSTSAAASATASVPSSMADGTTINNNADPTAAAASPPAANQSQAQEQIQAPDGNVEMQPQPEPVVKTRKLILDEDDDLSSDEEAKPQESSLRAFENVQSNDPMEEGKEEEEPMLGPGQLVHPSTSTTSLDRPFDETPSKCSSASVAAASSASPLAADAELSSAALTEESTSVNHDAADTVEDQDMSTSFGDEKLVLHDDHGDGNEGPYGEDDEDQKKQQQRRSKSVKKSDKKKRRKTIALKEDSLLRASLSPASSKSNSADDATNPLPEIAAQAEATPSISRKSTEDRLLLSGSTSACRSATSTPASASSGDSFALAAKAKDSMQKTSSYAGADGRRSRRSERRRALELQSETNSLVMSASPASGGSNDDTATSDAQQKQHSILAPSPAPSLDGATLLSRGGLESVSEIGEFDSNEVAAPTFSNVAPVDDGSAIKPPLAPTRSSRRKSILPERLRQEDVLLDPKLTLNQAEGRKIDSSEPGEAQNSASSAVQMKIGEEATMLLASSAAQEASATPSGKDTQPQKKRRRRSSIGIISGGGLLTQKEVDGLSAYAESQKLGKKAKRARQTNLKQSSVSAGENDGASNDVDSADAATLMDSKPSAGVEANANITAAASLPTDDASAPVPMREEPLKEETAEGAGKMMKVSVTGQSETMEAVVVNEEGIPPPDENNTTGTENAEPTMGDTTIHATLEKSPAERKQPSAIRAAPSPMIEEEDDPLGIKARIAAPKNELSEEQSTEELISNIIRSDFWFDEEAINARAIRKRIPMLFSDPDATTKPCLSARLFACASIVLETSKADMDGRGKRPAAQFQSVLPMLIAFVQAELISLSGESPAKAAPKPKVLQFSSFDGSATMPPVDRKSGSQSHLEKNIHSLEKVFKEVESLVKDQSSGAIEEEIKECLDVMIFTLRYIETDANDCLRKELADSMPFYWPAGRFVKAARTYREEFEDVRLLLEQDVHANKDSALRHRLGDFIGRVIRFYLRRFMDPVPLNLTNDRCENYRHVDLTKVRSVVSDIVEMVDPDGDGRDTAAADGSISSVFSYALRAVHALFNLSADLAEKGELFSDVFSSEASQRGLGQGRSPTVVLTDDDLQAILGDIHECHIVLQGIKGARFISSLLRWPGVSDAIKDAGGWRKVEAYAGMIESLDLEKACPEEEYFSLLGSIEGLLSKLDANAEAMAAIENTCEVGLRACWKRFRCGTKSKAILQGNPSISIIASYLRDGKSLAFPSLAEPSFELSEEEA